MVWSNTPSLRDEEETWYGGMVTTHLVCIDWSITVEYAPVCTCQIISACCSLGYWFHWKDPKNSTLIMTQCGSIIGLTENEAYAFTACVLTSICSATRPRNSVGLVSTHWEDIGVSDSLGMVLTLEKDFHWFVNGVWRRSACTCAPCSVS